MSYQAEPTFQIYGNQKFLTHNIKGQTEADDRHLFGLRMESYGIFDFKAMSEGQKKEIVLAESEIVSPISLISAYAFGTDSSFDGIVLNLLFGGVLIGQQTLNANIMPYEFPKGNIIEPTQTIEIEATHSLNQLFIYWQPIHILSRTEIF